MSEIRPRFTLVSYERCRCCGEHCDAGDQSTERQPCWGKVGRWEAFSRVDVGDIAGPYRHSCLGHADPIIYEPFDFGPKRPLSTASGGDQQK
jgi:hypothetical protein